MTKAMRETILVLLVLGLVVAVPAGEKSPNVTGIFSNMKYIGETGDVVGMEVFIVYSTDGIKGQYYALLQEAEGLPAPPVLVKLMVTNSLIEFTLSYGSENTRTFRGKVSDKELVGKFDSLDQVIRLQRKKSYWQ